MIFPSTKERIVGGKPAVRSASSIARTIEHPLRVVALVVLGQFLFAGAIEGVSLYQHAALDAQAARELNLAEVRSLSRSLQRDTVNVMFERDAREKAIIEAKLRKRFAEIRFRTDRAVASLKETDADQASKLDQLETSVIARLKQVLELSRHAGPEQGYAVFRANVRPVEREASELTDRIIDQENARSAAMRERIRQVDLLGGALLLILLVAALRWIWSNTRRGLTADVIAPLAAVTDALNQLTKSYHSVSVPGEDLDNEIGDIARAAKVFKARSALVERLNVFMSVTPNTIIVADQARRIIFWNPAAEQLLGWTEAEAFGQSLDILIPKRDRPAHQRAFARVTGPSPDLVGRPIEIAALCKDGSEIQVEVTIGTWREDNGVNVGLVARDLTERNMAEAERARTSNLLNTVVESMPVSLFVKDGEEHRLQLVNRAFEAMTGYNREAVLGKSDADLFPQDEARGFVERDKQVLAQDGLDITEESITRADGSVRILRTRKLGIGGGDQPRLLLAMAEDITDSKEAQQRIQHMAHHDSLTGLPNRFSHSDELKKAIDQPDVCGAVLSIDLDRFKAVNDVYGHPIGDQVLCEVARRLRDVLDSHFVARIGGDEFEAIATNLETADQARQLGQQVVEALSAPIFVERATIYIGASVGIAMFPQDGSDCDTLMRNADLALYRAKGEGRGSCRFFEPEMDRVQREHRELEGDLRQALHNREIRPYFQPLADVATGQITGFEALARWTHLTRGPISPDVFIPIAEASGQIVELGRQILEAAIAEAATWEPALTVAVNLSPLQFHHGDIATEVATLLEKTGLSATKLELEITEGTLIRDTERAVASLKALKALGVRIAMDDFGTGYSSLSYFRMFPFDKVKIDQSFVRDMGANPQALAIVQAVIGLGRGLGLHVVAEGVETAPQVEALRAEGCDQVQGFLIGRPNPINYFEHIVLERRAGASKSGQTHAA